MKVISAEMFIDRCKDKFGWRDLSRDVIMDVGCGEEGLCGKVILEKFPEVRAIIGIDKKPNVVRNFRLRTTTKMKCAVADIQRRETLRNYEGQMTKVISTHVFDVVMEKEEAFRNVFRLLKPGGEAAVLFDVNNLIEGWMKEMHKKPKWKEAYKRYYDDNLYKFEFGADQCKKMVEKIGFKVIESKEETRLTHYPDPDYKEEFYNKSRERFNLPSELLEEFKEEGFRVFKNLSTRDAAGRTYYRLTELSLLISKPTEF